MANDRGGRRKDGKPYAKNNTREDGSYINGKNRPPKEHAFAVNDGRRRGCRKKGKKNTLTEWREELDSKITISEGGKTRRMSKRLVLIKAMIDRAIKKSDRAAETVLRYAEMSEKRDPGLQAEDLEVIAAWLDSVLNTGDSDDADALTNQTDQASRNGDADNDGSDD